MSRPSRVVLPVLDLEQNDKPVIKRVVKGAKNYTQQKISSDSNSNQSCSFSFQPPSQNSIVDRKFVLKAQVRIDLGAGNNFSKATPTAVGGAPDVGQNLGFPLSRQRISQQSAVAIAAGGARAAVDAPAIVGGAFVKFGNNFAPRQFPLSAIIDTIDLTINGTHFTASLNQYLNAVMEYTTPEYRSRVFSQVAHHPDKNAYANTFGDLDHPLNLSGENGRAGEKPRGTLLDDATIATRYLTFDLEEPIFLSPLMAEFGHGMTNVNDISIQINWNSSLSKAFSVVDIPAAVQTARTNPVNVANLTAAPIDIQSTSLMVRYYTAQDDIKIPNEIILPYKQPKVVIKEVAHTNGTATDAIGNNIRLNQVPECVFVYLKVRRSDRNVGSHDTSARISKINIDFMNSTGLLSSLTERDLVRLATENGLDEIDNEYLQNGLVLKLMFGKDIPLPDNVSAGTRGDYSIQINPTIASQAGTANYEMFQVYFYNGHAVVSPNECKVSTGLLDLRDNVEAEDMGHEYYEKQLSGGSSVGGSVVGGSIVGGKMGHLVRRLGKHGGMKAMEKFAPAVAAGGKAYMDYKTRQ